MAPTGRSTLRQTTHRLARLPWHRQEDRHCDRPHTGQHVYHGTDMKIDTAIDHTQASTFTMAPTGRSTLRQTTHRLARLLWHRQEDQHCDRPHTGQQVYYGTDRKIDTAIDHTQASTFTMAPTGRSTLRQTTHRLARLPWHRQEDRYCDRPHTGLSRLPWHCQEDRYCDRSHTGQHVYRGTDRKIDTAIDHTQASKFTMALTGRSTLRQTTQASTFTMTLTGRSTLRQTTHRLARLPWHRQEDRHCDRPHTGQHVYHGTDRKIDIAIDHTQASTFTMAPTGRSTLRQTTHRLARLPWHRQEDRHCDRPHTGQHVYHGTDRKIDIAIDHTQASTFTMAPTGRSTLRQTTHRPARLPWHRQEDRHCDRPHTGQHVYHGTDRKIDTVIDQTQASTFTMAPTGRSTLRQTTHRLARLPWHRQEDRHCDRPHTGQQVYHGTDRKIDTAIDHTQASTFTMAPTGRSTLRQTTHRLASLLWHREEDRHCDRPHTGQHVYHGTDRKIDIAIDHTQASTFTMAPTGRSTLRQTTHRLARLPWHRQEDRHCDRPHTGQHVYHGTDRKIDIAIDHTQASKFTMAPTGRSTLRQTTHRLASLLWHRQEDRHCDRPHTGQHVYHGTDRKINIAIDHTQASTFTMAPTGRSILRQTTHRAITFTMALPGRSILRQITHRLARLPWHRQEDRHCDRPHTGQHVYHGTDRKIDIAIDHTQASTFTMAPTGRSTLRQTTHRLARLPWHRQEDRHCDRPHTCQQVYYGTDRKIDTAIGHTQASKFTMAPTGRSTLRQTTQASTFTMTLTGRSTLRQTTHRLARLPWHRQEDRHCDRPHTGQHVYHGTDRKIDIAIDHTQASTFTMAPTGRSTLRQTTHRLARLPWHRQEDRHCDRPHTGQQVYYGTDRKINTAIDHTQASKFTMAPTGRSTLRQTTHRLARLPWHRQEDQHCDRPHTGQHVYHGTDRKIDTAIDHTQGYHVYHGTARKIDTAIDHTQASTFTVAPTGRSTLRQTTHRLARLPWHRQEDRHCDRPHTGQHVYHGTDRKIDTAIDHTQASTFTMAPRGRSTLRQTTHMLASLLWHRQEDRHCDRPYTGQHVYHGTDRKIDIAIDHTGQHVYHDTDRKIDTAIDHTQASTFTMAPTGRSTLRQTTHRLARLPWHRQEDRHCDRPHTGQHVYHGTDRKIDTAIDHTQASTFTMAPTGRSTLRQTTHRLARLPWHRQEDRHCDRPHTGQHVYHGTDRKIDIAIDHTQASTFTVAPTGRSTLRQTTHRLARLPWHRQEDRHCDRPHTGLSRLPWHCQEDRYCDRSHTGQHVYRGTDRKIDTAIDHTQASKFTMALTGRSTLRQTTQASTFTMTLTGRSTLRQTTHRLARLPWHRQEDRHCDRPHTGQHVYHGTDRKIDIAIDHTQASTFTMAPTGRSTLRQTTHRLARLPWHRQEDRHCDRPHTGQHVYHGTDRKIDIAIDHTQASTFTMAPTGRSTLRQTTHRPARLPWHRQEDRHCDRPHTGQHVYHGTDRKIDTVIDQTQASTFTMAPTGRSTLRQTTHRLARLPWHRQEDRHCDRPHTGQQVYHGTDRKIDTAIDHTQASTFTMAPTGRSTLRQTTHRLASLLWHREEDRHCDRPHTGQHVYHGTDRKIDIAIDHTQASTFTMAPTGRSTLRQTTHRLARLPWHRQEDRHCDRPHTGQHVYHGTDRKIDIAIDHTQASKFTMAPTGRSTLRQTTHRLASLLWHRQEDRHCDRPHTGQHVYHGTDRKINIAIDHTQASTFTMAPTGRSILRQTTHRAITFTMALPGRSILRQITHRLARLPWHRQEDRHCDRPHTGQHVYHGTDRKIDIAIDHTQASTFTMAPTGRSTLRQTTHRLARLPWHRQEDRHCDRPHTCQQVYYGTDRKIDTAIGHTQASKFTMAPTGRSTLRQTTQASTFTMTLTGRSTLRQTTHRLARLPWHRQEDRHCDRPHTGQHVYHGTDRKIDIAIDHTQASTFTMAPTGRSTLRQTTHRLARLPWHRQEDRHCDRPHTGQQVYYGTDRKINTAIDHTQASKFTMAPTGRSTLRQTTHRLARLPWHRQEDQHCDRPHTGQHVYHGTDRKIDTAIDHTQGYHVYHGTARKIDTAIDHTQASTFTVAPTGRSTLRQTTHRLARLPWHRQEDRHCDRPHTGQHVYHGTDRKIDTAIDHTQASTFTMAPRGRSTLRQTTHMLASLLWHRQEDRHCDRPYTGQHVYHGTDRKIDIAIDHTGQHVYHDTDRKIDTAIDHTQASTFTMAPTGRSTLRQTTHRLARLPWHRQEDRHCDRPHTGQHVYHGTDRKIDTAIDHTQASTFTMAPTGRSTLRQTTHRLARLPWHRQEDRHCDRPHTGQHVYHGTDRKIDIAIDHTQASTFTVAPTGRSTLRQTTHRLARLPWHRQEDRHCDRPHTGQHVYHGTDRKIDIAIDHTQASTFTMAPTGRSTLRQTTHRLASLPWHQQEDRHCDRPHTGQHVYHGTDRKIDTAIDHTQASKFTMAPRGRSTLRQNTHRLARLPWHRQEDRYCDRPHTGQHVYHGTDRKIDTAIDHTQASTFTMAPTGRSTLRQTTHRLARLPWHRQEDRHCDRPHTGQHVYRGTDRKIDTAIDHTQASTFTMAPTGRSTLRYTTHRLARLPWHRQEDRHCDRPHTGQHVYHGTDRKIDTAIDHTQASTFTMAPTGRSTLRQTTHRLASLPWHRQEDRHCDRPHTCQQVYYGTDRKIDTAIDHTQASTFTMAPTGRSTLRQTTHRLARLPWHRQEDRHCDRPHTGQHVYHGTDRKIDTAIDHTQASTFTMAPTGRSTLRQTTNSLASLLWHRQEDRHCDRPHTGQHVYHGTDRKIDIAIDHTQDNTFTMTLTG